MFRGSRNCFLGGGIQEVFSEEAAMELNLKELDVFGVRQED